MIPQMDSADLKPGDRRAVWHVTITVEPGRPLRCRVACTPDVAQPYSTEFTVAGIEPTCEALRGFLTGLAAGDGAANDGDVNDGAADDGAAGGSAAGS